MFGEVKLGEADYTVMSLGNTVIYVKYLVSNILERAF